MYRTDSNSGELCELHGLCCATGGREGVTRFQEGSFLALSGSVQGHHVVLGMRSVVFAMCRPLAVLQTRCDAWSTSGAEPHQERAPAEGGNGVPARHKK